ncbi:MAG: peptide/nickel transport system substrate-binding protein [Euryarchaeota archaeon]|nr:peptide/nickel transport system substrate-binding protein [Euryarchaeota archaeon]
MKYDTGDTMSQIGLNSRRVEISLAAFFIALILFGCSHALADGTKQTLVVGEPWKMDGIDPALKSYNLNNFLVAEGLTAISPDFKIVPCIADSWETVGDDTWRFHLNSGVKFHDGSMLTADDCKYALDRSMEMNPDVVVSLNIKDINVVDSLTIDITTNTPDASLPARMAYGRASIYKNNEQSDGSISTPICTGPFKFASYDQASDTLVIARNEDYRGGAPKLDEVTVMFGIGDANSREMAIEKGELDFTTEPPMGSTERLKANADLNVTIHKLCQGYKLKFGSVAKAPYDDVMVRQAIAYAIDRKSIVDDILLGRGEVSDGNALTPGLEWRNNDIEGYSYDTEKAKELLEKAGWKDTDGDGIVDKDGKPFKITLYTWPERPALPLIEQAVQSELKEIGIEAEARIMDSTAIKEHTSEWGMIWASGGDTCMMIPDPSYYLERQFLSTDSTNDYGYKNSEVDELLLKARSTFDQDERYDLYKQVQKIVYDDDCAQVPIAYHYLCVVMKKDVKGYIPNPAHHDYSLSTGMYRE